MNYCIAYVLLELSSAGMMNGMNNSYDEKVRVDPAGHTYYFYRAMSAIERKDASSVWFYCKTDKRLVPEIEQVIKRDLESNTWAVGVINDIKKRNQARL